VEALVARFQSLFAQGRKLSGSSDTHRVLRSPRFAVRTGGTLVLRSLAPKRPPTQWLDHLNEPIDLQWAKRQ